MAELCPDKPPLREVAGAKLFAWFLTLIGLWLMAAAMVGRGTTDDSSNLIPDPAVLWPVTIESGDTEDSVSLEIPNLVSSSVLPTDSTITYSISFDSVDFERIDLPAVLLERPLHNASATWDGVEVDLINSHGGDSSLGDASLLGLLPIDQDFALDSHTLGLTLRGAHGYLGVVEGVTVGEFSSLELAQQSREYRQVFGAVALLATSFILLLLGLTSESRDEFVAAGLFCLAMGFAICTFTDQWSLMPGGIEYRLRTRHATLALAPFFGLSALMFIIQVRQGFFVSLIGTVSLSLALVAMFWPDSTVLPFVRQAEQAVCVAALGYGFYKSLKHSLQGVLEARIVILVVLALLFPWGLAIKRHGMVGDGAIMVSAFVGVCLSMMLLQIRRYLTSADRYAELVSEAIDAILVVDRQGNVVESNPSARLLLTGSTAETSGAINILEKVEPLDVEACRDLLVEGVGGKAALKFPIFGSALGRQRAVHVESVSIALDKTHTLLVLQDVTQRRQIEERIIASARMETLGIVARGIAHDYNNTLSAVLGQLTMLNHEVLDADSDLINRIERIIVETSERTRKQLATVRGGNEPTRSVDPKDLVERTRELIVGTLPDKVNLTLNIEEGLPSVQCKAVEIEQVLLNLVTNSRDVLSDRGSGEIEIRASNAGDGFVVFSVTDDGPKIPEEHANLVWSPFFSSAGRELGSGLVLSVVQRVVREHGGKVKQMTPGNGNGAKFEVHIPVSESTPVSENEAPVSKFGVVLVVEDEPNIREVMVSILRLRGFTVAQAESAEVARAQFRPEDFQLLVTDVIMGVEHGISLATYFTKVNPRLAVLVVSGQVPDELQTSDTWAFLDKPFTPEMLVASARKAILLSKVSTSEALND